MPSPAKSISSTLLEMTLSPMLITEVEAPLSSISFIFFVSCSSESLSFLLESFIVLYSKAIFDSESSNLCCLSLYSSTYFLRNLILFWMIWRLPPVFNISNWGFCFKYFWTPVASVEWRFSFLGCLCLLVASIQTCKGC